MPGPGDSPKRPPSLSSPSALNLVAVLSAPGDRRGPQAVVAALSKLGLQILEDVAKDGLSGERASGRRLARLNDRLLAELGGGVLRPPALAPGEVRRRLAGQASEAVAAFAKEVSADPGGQLPSVVWADPRLSLLLPFWIERLDVDPLVVFVHGPPPAGVFSGADAVTDRAKGIATWARYNKAAWVLSTESPSVVLGVDSIASDPKHSVGDLVRLMATRGVAVDSERIDEAAQTMESVVQAGLTHGEPPVALSVVPGDIGVGLSKVFDTLDGAHIEGQSPAWSLHEELEESIAGLYDQTYYEEGYTIETGAPPYRRDEEHWISFFNGVAEGIVKTMAPSSFLDVGCAIGMLVESLRERGVDAEGIDLSEWAISQVPDDLKPFCNVGSITEELDGHYDVISCIEVIEHLPAFLADDAIGNLCRHADSILFSSTPDDFDEPTHFNVESGDYWAKLFWKHGFARDGLVDATFLAPNAVVFKRFDEREEELVDAYELVVAQADARLSELRRLREEAVAEHDRVVDLYTEASENLTRISLQHAAMGEEFKQTVEQLTRINRDLSDLKLRRAAEIVAHSEAVSALEASQTRLAGRVEALEAELEAVMHTKVFRYSAGLRRIYGRMRGVGDFAGGPALEPKPEAGPPPAGGGSYSLWVQEYDTIDDGARDVVKRRVARLEHRPLISIIVPVYDPQVDHLRDAVRSVSDQLYGNWELCLVDDCSSNPQIPQLLDELAAADDRVKVAKRTVNGHIAVACNSALELATGDWVATLDHDDLLSEQALALVALAIEENPRAGVVYSDEDKIGPDGRRCDPYFKPDFDPLLLVAQNYMTHLCVIRRELLSKVGGFREGFEGSQDWDVILRVTEQLEATQVVHVPHVLYHWRIHPGSTSKSVFVKPYALTAGQRAVEEHLERTHRSAEVLSPAGGGPLRVKWQIPDTPPLVSIVIPTRDGAHLRRCLESLFRLTTYPRTEVIIVDNGSTGGDALDFLRAYEDALVVMRDDGPFNYSRLNNEAVARSSGEVLCLLNDDTEITEGQWLDELVSQVTQPGIGAAGAMLYYEDGRVQHAGVVLGIGGVAGHAHRRADHLSPGYFSDLHLARRFSAVTAACVAIRRQVWDEVGGLDSETFPVAFNDVDLCLRIRRAGWDIVWTPFAHLVHFESASRGLDTEGERALRFAGEIRSMKTRWGEELRSDPFYNPNLTLESEDFSLAWPPRVR